MEKLRRVVSEIAYTHNPTKLSPVHRSLIPFLCFSSSLYKFALFIRHNLYQVGFFAKHRLSVPVVSVGNLTWGGNGKTPMVEFLALWLSDCGLSPLIVSRGYGGGDEVNMLQRHLHGTPTKLGVGANRAAVAYDIIQKYGYVDTRQSAWYDKLCLNRKVPGYLESEKVGIVVLDDGMQHLSLWRDLEIVMVNGLSLWGNLQLMPLGPLREPLTALRRADMVVVHHADLVSEHILKDIELLMQEINDSVRVFFTRLDPSYLFEVGNINTKLPLKALQNAIVLCISAIGSPDSFVKRIQKMGALFVDRVDFSDHHIFHDKDVEMIRARLGDLEGKFGNKPIVAVTEKDYDRDTEIFKQLYPFEVLVLCSKLKVVPIRGGTEDRFKKFLKDKVKLKLPVAKSTSLL